MFFLEVKFLIMFAALLLPKNPSLGCWQMASAKGEYP
jgi:hypothetical protein